MAAISDVLKDIGDDNLEVQLITQSAIRYKQNKKNDDLEITFATDKKNFGESRQAVIVWVDSDKFSSSLSKFTK